MQALLVGLPIFEFLEYRLVFLNQICQFVDFVTVSLSRTVPIWDVSLMPSFE